MNEWTADHILAAAQEQFEQGNKVRLIDDFDGDQFDVTSVHDRKIHGHWWKGSECSTSEVARVPSNGETGGVRLTDAGEAWLRAQTGLGKPVANETAEPEQPASGIEPKPAPGTLNAFAAKAKGMPVEMKVDVKASDEFINTLRNQRRHDIAIELAKQNASLIYGTDLAHWAGRIAEATDALMRALGDTAPANIATCE